MGFKNHSQSVVSLWHGNFPTDHHRFVVSPRSSQVPDVSLELTEASPEMWGPHFQVNLGGKTWLKRG